MVTEKLEAAQDAACRLMLGTKPHGVVRGYRSKVRATGAAVEIDLAGFRHAGARLRC